MGQKGAWPKSVIYFTNFGTSLIHYLWNGWRYTPQILHADWW